MFISLSRVRARCPRKQEVGTEIQDETRETNRGEMGRGKQESTARLAASCRRSPSILRHERKHSEPSPPKFLVVGPRPRPHVNSGLDHFC